MRPATERICRLQPCANRYCSGKSSLILTLLRLLDLRSGAIFIDGVDISTLPRQLIRSNITTIPQDPFLPPTHSLRRNLAGSAAGVSDNQLVAALDKVGLLGHVISQLMTSEGGNTVVSGAQGMSMVKAARILDAKMSLLPLSAGQQQLFCLARALLQHNRIVILDEVTSAIDTTTEEILRRVLQDELKGKTVVMIAHRATMLGICDVIVELDGGIVTKVSHRQGES